jgi:fructose-1,6-bisphosphatase/sedoheptulose 1,7-bisphosphatase-like protein
MVALEAAPADVRATIEALTVFPTAFDEESAADVLAGVVGAGAGVDVAACKKSLDAAVSAGLLNHDTRRDTYKVGPGR